MADKLACFDFLRTVDHRLWKYKQNNDISDLLNMNIYIIYVCTVPEL